MTKNWYVLRAKPYKEEILYNQLNYSNIEVYYPRIQVHPVNPRSKKIKPYFPGYLFIHVEPKDVKQSQILWMPHSLGLVSYGEEPAIVADHLIHTIERQITEIAELGGEIYSGLRPGDVVVIDYSPFKGYEGIFDTQLPGKDRVRILINFINSRHVPIKIPAGYVRKKKST